MVAEIRTGEVTPESEVGWLVISDALACLRIVRDFVTKQPPAKEPRSGKRGRRE